MHKRLLFASLTVALGFLTATNVRGDDYLLADGQAWPGKILLTDNRDVRVLFERSSSHNDQEIPKVRSLTTLRDGRVVFCSGVDRSIMEVTAQGERVLHHGGYLARQVRTDTNGDLYWSGLETPVDNNPLPDGFIYKFDWATRQVHTVLTFSQADVQRDWWGAFDVRHGRVTVATLRPPSSVYEIENSLPRKLYTLPIGATSIRFTPEGHLLACDGQGKLYRFEDPRHPERFETILARGVEFVDFCPAPR